MKKCTALFLSIILILMLVACDKKYKVLVADDYPIANEIQKTYSAGGEVTIQLETLTEHYYALFVNGMKQEMDLSASDMVYTYFVFTMPSEDVLVEIEDHWVDIPGET